MMFFPVKYGAPYKNVWLLSKLGMFTVGVQYEPRCDGSPYDRRCDNLKNWSCAIGYGVGSNPLTPSFNVCLEVAKSSQLIASFYQHLVVQRRVQNPLEENEMRITNFIDLGIELQTNYANYIPADLTFQMAASWQANENFLLKGKVGTQSASVAMALKAWWNPSVTFHLSATKSTEERTGFGFGIHIKNSDKETRYERANRELLADQTMLY